MQLDLLDDKYAVAEAERLERAAADETQRKARAAADEQAGELVIPVLGSLLAITVCLGGLLSLLRLSEHNFYVQVCLHVVAVTGTLFFWGLLSVLGYWVFSCTSDFFMIRARGGSRGEMIASVAAPALIIIVMIVGYFRW
jgi:hypothetical protein